MNASDIDLITLRLFVAIAEELNMTRAARREHLVLPAASKRLKDLEEKVGAPLLYRHARGVMLAPAGLSFLHHARQVLLTLDRMGAELSEFASGVKGHLRIHANTSAIAEFLPEQLGTFMTQNPMVKVDLEEQVSTAIVRAVADGSADIGIFDAGTPSGKLEIFFYRQDRLVVVAPNGHPIAKRKQVSFRDVLKYDFVGPHADSSLHAWLTRAAAAAGLPLRLRVQLRSFDCMCRMIQANLGIGILPMQYVRPATKSMRLVSVRLDEPWAERKLLLGVREFTALPVVARKLVERLSRGN